MTVDIDGYSFKHMHMLFYNQNNQLLIHYMYVSALCSGSIIELNMEKATTLRINAYKNELNEKISILETLLANYDDGRCKGLFCLAVNLLEMLDVRHVMEQILIQTQTEQSVKDRHLWLFSYFRVWQNNGT